MKAAIFAYTRQGIQTGKKVLTGFPDCEIHAFAPERICESGFNMIPSGTVRFYKEQFAWADALIFISSCGIAVRLIAPYIQNKTIDPAVICIDDMGQYVIPILSGHIGGANDLARKTAVLLDALPIITTATDNHQRFSVDSWTARNGYFLENIDLAKEISALILEQDIPFASQLPVSAQLPNGLFFGTEGKLGICFGWEKLNPFEKTLHIIPKCLHLGIGCRKNTKFETFKESVITVLEQAQIDIRAVKLAASIDLKSNETGILEFCRYLNIPVYFYSPEELQNVTGCFSHSDFVQKTTGVDNVCERASMVNADRLILPKHILNGVTVALSAEIKEVSFV